jgi:hypothetical protein
MTGYPEAGTGIGERAFAAAGHGPPIARAVSPV